MTSPFYFSCPAFLINPSLAPKSQSFSCSPISQPASLINISLDLCHIFLVFFSMQLSHIFHSNVCVIGTRLRKIPFQHPNPCLRAQSILITKWVTSKLKSLSSLDPMLSFLSPDMLIPIQCFSRSPHLSTSHVSTNAVSHLSDFLLLFTNSNSIHLYKSNSNLITQAFPPLPFSSLCVGVLSSHLSRHSHVYAYAFFAIYIPVGSYLISLNTYQTT